MGWRVQTQALASMTSGLVGEASHEILPNIRPVFTVFMTGIASLVSPFSNISHEVAFSLGSVEETKFPEIHGIFSSVYFNILPFWMACT